MSKQTFTDRLRLAYRSVKFWIVFLGVLVPVFVGIAVFVILYSLAIMGPWISSRFHVKDKVRKVVDRVFGIGHILDFREDIRDLVSKHSDVEIGDRKSSEIRQSVLDVHQNASNRAERGEFLIAILVGITSLVLSIITGVSVIGWMLGLYSIVMSLTVGLHVVVLDILAYNKDDEFPPYRRQELVLMEGWNRALLSNWSLQAYILMIGILYRTSERGYEIGKDLIDTILEKDYSRSESVRYISAFLAQTADGLIGAKK